MEELRKTLTRRLTEALKKGVFGGHATDSAMASIRSLSAGKDLKPELHAAMLEATLNVTEKLKAPELKYGDIFPEDEALRPPSERLVAATEKALKDYGAAMGWTEEVREKR